MALSEDEQKYHDEIVRRRLINDGDGMGDDRKLNSLAKAYVTLEEGEENEEIDADRLKRFIQSIKQVGFLAKRTVQAIKVNEEAKQNYIDLKAQVQSEILGAQYFIDKSTALLEEDAKNRKYGGTIDAFTKLVKSKPDRKLTEIKCKELALELEGMKKRQAWIQGQLENRKRALSMLSGAVEVVKDLVRDSGGEVSVPPVIPMEVDSTTPGPVEQLTPQNEDMDADGAVVEPIAMAGTDPPPSASVAPEDDKSNSEKHAESGTPVTPMELDSTATAKDEDGNGAAVVEPMVMVTVTNSVAMAPPSSASGAPEGDKSNSEKYEDISD